MNLTKFGFTMIELLMVIVIVGILSIVSVPIYNGYIRKSIATEGKTLLAAIHSGEISYYYRTGTYCSISKNTNNSAALGVNARTNKYFTSFSVSTDSDGFTAVTNYPKMSMTYTLVGSLTAQPEITPED